MSYDEKLSALLPAVIENLRIVSDCLRNRALCQDDKWRDDHKEYCKNLSRKIDDLLINFDRKDLS
jgi:hypothetical protein